MNRKPHIFLGERRKTGYSATRGTPAEFSAIIGDAFGGSSSVIFLGDWLVQNTFDGFDRKIGSTDAAGGLVLNTFDPGGRTIASETLGSPRGPTPTDRSGSANALLASSEARFDEAGRRYGECNEGQESGVVFSRENGPSGKGEGCAFSPEAREPSGGPLVPAFVASLLEAEIRKEDQKRGHSSN